MNNQFVDTAVMPNQDFDLQATYTDQNDKFSMQNIMFNERIYNAIERMSRVMAGGSCTIPNHLRGKTEDCFAIICQALRWGFDPYAVAQKTFLISGTLGYESQLIISVINARAPIVDRINYEWFGPWENVVGKFVTKTGKSGSEYQAPGWKFDDEKGCGVRVFATMKGEEEPRVLELLLSQASVRNSTLWASDPKQQLAYLAAKRWARLHAPEAVLGLYSPDELEDRESLKDVTPKPATASSTGAPTKGTSKLKEKLKERSASVNTVDTTEDAKVLEPTVNEEDATQKPSGRKKSSKVAAQNPIGELLTAFEEAGSIKELIQIGTKVKELNLAEDSVEHNQLSTAFKSRKAFLEVYDAINTMTAKNQEQVYALLTGKVDIIDPTAFAELHDMYDEYVSIMQGEQ